MHTHLQTSVSTSLLLLPVADLEIFKGGFKIFDDETKKEGLSNLEVTFVVLLSQDIGFSVLSNLLNPFT